MIAAVFGLARIIYSMLKCGHGYTDAGAEYYEAQHHERALRNARHRARKLGYQLVPLGGHEADGTGAPGPPIAGLATV